MEKEKEPVFELTKKVGTLFAKTFKAEMDLHMVVNCTLDATFIVEGVEIYLKIETTKK